MVTLVAVGLAIFAKAIGDNTNVVPGEEDRDGVAPASSTIFTVIILSMQTPGFAELMHRTSYELPHAEPSFHIGSATAANKLFEGNADWLRH